MRFYAASWFGGLVLHVGSSKRLAWLCPSLERGKGRARHLQLNHDHHVRRTVVGRGPEEQRGAAGPTRRGRTGKRLLAFPFLFFIPSPLVMGNVLRVTFC